jgi:SapC protein
MASQPPANVLPLFYGDLEPLSSSLHPNFKSRASDKAPFLVGAHAVPITIDEFISVQRYCPIIFSVGETSLPLALMGLNEGVNVFVDDEGKLLGETYVPAYVRRYPFMLARLAPDAQELSLCFDPTSGLVGEFDEGQPLFDGDKPTEATNSILKFCEEFELSAQRTTHFMKELQDAELLMDGEVSIQAQGSDQPVVYRGFMMVNEEKLRDMRGDELRKMNQNGMLALIFAHLFSMQLMRELFAKQMEQGKGPAIPGFSPGIPVGAA